MSCVGCTQKILEENARHEKIFEEAQDKATATGRWFGIYRDEQGQYQYIDLQYRSQYPNIERIISPKL